MARGRGGILAGAMSGSVGGLTFQRQGDTVQVRERVTPRDPKTSEQLTARARMDEVAGLWAGLSDEEHAAWVRFAAATGVKHAWGAFLGLTSKWMVLHPRAPWEGASPPRLPPTGPFYGDNVTVRILPLGGGEGGGSLPGGQDGHDSLGGNAQDPTPTPPQGEGKSSILTVEASQPNAAGVATEILVQRLANARRKPRERDWKAAAVVVFEAGSLTASVPLPPSAYAVAYRFVRPASGQATGVTPLGVATVEEATGKALP